MNRKAVQQMIGAGLVMILAGCSAPEANSTPLPLTVTSSPTAPIPVASTLTPVPIATPIAEQREFIEGVYCRKVDEQGSFDFLRFFPDGLVMNIQYGYFSDCESAWDEARLWLVPERVSENIHGEYFLYGDHIEFGVGGDEILVDWVGVYRDASMILNAKPRVAGIGDEGENLEYSLMDVED